MMAMAVAVVTTEATTTTTTTRTTTTTAGAAVMVAMAMVTPTAACANYSAQLHFFLGPTRCGNGEDSYDPRAAYATPSPHMRTLHAIWASKYL